MKVQHIQQFNKKQEKAPQFGNAGSAALRYLATNQGVGANLTDLSFMVIPRIATDAKRGPAACLETTRREASGTANHSLIGAYGMLAGGLASLVMGFGNKFGTGVNNIFAAPETLRILAENKARQVKNNATQIDYIKETLANIKGFNPTSEYADTEGFVKLSKDTIDDVAEVLNRAINKEGLTFNEWSSKKAADSLHVALNKIIADTGADSKYILEDATKEIKSQTSLKTLLEDVFKVSKTFNKEKVLEAFKSQVENNKGITDNAFMKKLTTFMKTKSIAGVLMATAIGCSIQPLNIYLTKLKTGSDGFVGVEGRSKDDSVGFKALKVGSAAAFFAMVLTTLGTGIKGFMDKMSFKGFWPTISQLKGIYGLTIISRIFATRDKDELREALTKDTLGFLSWLVLGDIVNKLTATALDDPDATVLNTTEKEAKGIWAKTKRAFNASLKTRDEILIESLAAKDVKTTKIKDGKVIAKTFKEMMADLNNIADKEFVKTAKRRLSTLNKAQLAGYAFSGLVLGLGIPNLNIYLTNRLDKKRKAKAAQEAQQAQLAKA